MTSDRSIVVIDSVIRSVGFGLQGHIRRRGWRELRGFGFGRRRRSRRRGRDFRLGVGLGQIEPLCRGGAADANCGDATRGPPTPPPNLAEGIQGERETSASPTARPGSGCEGAVRLPSESPRRFSGRRPDDHHEAMHLGSLTSSSDSPSRNRMPGVSSTSSGPSRMVIDLHGCNSLS
jgi:hypothetical protein